MSIKQQLSSALVCILLVGSFAASADIRVLALRDATANSSFSQAQMQHLLTTWNNTKTSSMPDLVVTSSGAPILLGGADLGGGGNTHTTIMDNAYARSLAGGDIYALPRSHRADVVIIFTDFLSTLCGYVEQENWIRSNGISGTFITPSFNPSPGAYDLRENNTGFIALVGTGLQSCSDPSQGVDTAAHEFSKIKHRTDTR